MNIFEIFYCTGALLTFGRILSEFLDSTKSERDEIMPECQKHPILFWLAVVFLVVTWPWTVWDVYFRKDS